MAQQTVNTAIDRVRAGNNESRKVTIASATAAQTIKPGQVLGRITAAGATNGHYTPTAITLSNGAEEAKVVVDDGQEVSIAAAATGEAHVIVTGKVNGGALSFSGSETLNSQKASKQSHVEALQDNGITILDVDAGAVSLRDNQ